MSQAPSGRHATVRIERLVTAGLFSLDGQDFEVENNVWLVGDDAEVVVVDAAHDAAAIVAAVGSRRLLAVVSTHGHNDHIDAAGEVSDATEGRRCCCTRTTGCCGTSSTPAASPSR